MAERLETASQVVYWRFMARPHRTCGEPLPTDLYSTNTTPNNTLIGHYPKAVLIDTASRFYYLLMFSTCCFPLHFQPQLGQPGHPSDCVAVDKGLLRVKPGTTLV